MPTNKCTYVLIPATASNAAKYCNAPTKYTIVKDDDNNNVRKYESFCPRHKAIIEKEKDKDWDFE
jgi:hypothetical protein